jgi:branched-chain amino acid transport system permease protein
MKRRRPLLLFAYRHRTGLGVLALTTLLLPAPLVLGNPYTLGILNLVGLHVLVALGLNLFIGYSGQISLGHAAFFGLGAYGSAVLSTSGGVPPLAALPLVAAGNALVAALVGLPALRLRGHYLAMATLGFNYVVHILFVQWDAVTGGPSGLWGVPPLALGGITVSGDVRWHYLIWGVAMASLALCLNLVRSGVGRGLFALAQDEVAAESFGVPVGRSKVQVFVLSAVMASVAGSLYAYYFGYVNPDSFTVFASLEMVIMVVVGGIGSVWGTLVGASFVTLLPHLLGPFEDGRTLVHGLILVVILVLLPEGLVTGIVERVRTSAVLRRRGTARGGTVG